MMLQDAPDGDAAYKLANNQKWLADVSSLCMVQIQVRLKRLLVIRWLRCALRRAGCRLSLYCLGMQSQAARIVPPCRMTLTAKRQTVY